MKKFFLETLPNTIPLLVIIAGLIGAVFSNPAKFKRGDQSRNT